MREVAAAPVVGVAFAVESFGAGGIVVFGHRFRRPRPVMTQNRPGTASSIRRFQIAMKMSTAIKISTLSPHQTVKHVARRVAVRGIAPHAPKPRRLAQVRVFSNTKPLKCCVVHSRKRFILEHAIMSFHFVTFSSPPETTPGTPRKMVDIRRENARHHDLPKSATLWYALCFEVTSSRTSWP